MEKELDYSAHVDAYADWITKVIPQKLRMLLWIFDVPYAEYRKMADMSVKVDEELKRRMH